MKRVEKRVDCAVCMYDAPHWYCCRLKCGEFEYCRNCKAECRQGDDSVDSMVYAWEAWKAKILGKPIFLETNDEDLQKDKRIEELEREVKALRDENEELKKKLHEYEPLPEFREILKKLYSTNDIENLEWTLNHVCGGRGSVNGWIAVSLFWKQKYETISKLVGFMTVEEIQYYLTNEAECETLYKAISKLKDQVKYTSNEWYSANSSNNSWKAAAECNSPKELIEKRETLEKEIGVYSRALKEWKESTGCPSPSAAKTMIECMTSWHHAYDDAKKEIESLKKALKTSNSDMQKELEHEIDTWQKATGRISPEEAKQYIDRLKDRLNKIHDCSVDW